VIIKEIVIYLIRVLNPVAFRRDRAKQIQMLRQITKYLRISLNPIAFERDRVKQIKARDKQIYGKDKQIQALQAKVEALLGATASDIDPLDFNTMSSMDRFFASEETKAKYFSDLQLSVYQLFLNALIDNVHIPKKTRVLDAGCGFGIFTKLMHEKLGVHNICGFDFSSVAIAKARAKHAGVDFFTHDIYDPLDGEYDVITCMETIEHLTDPEAAVRNLTGSLSSKGVLFLTVPDGRIDHYKNHINFWSPESWKIFVNRLSQGVFNVTVGMVQHPTVATLRYNWAILSRNVDENAFQI
jgi:2-polyprenyl-3-methyl-5-hydroxy-6-metoxy-1,4-benzoquinol methylase